MTITAMHPKLQQVLSNIEKVMIGKTDIAELSLVALLAEGHVLLEDVPGVGKTMMVRALARSVNASFKRIQFTPDLLPSDVLGVSIYNPKELEFQYRPGPIMGNIILADEINRTSPKTQSALLEGMEESSVTVDGNTKKLERPFFVMATQNPIEYEGTYPLPEAQLDRFLLKMKMGYPTKDEEIEVLTRTQKQAPIEGLDSVISLDELVELQDQVKEVYVDHTIKHYIVELSHYTRTHKSVYLGVSPRASIALMKASQAYAFLHGRDFIIPDDVQYLAPFVFSHRIILKADAKYGGKTAEDIIKEILHYVQVPVKRAVR
ncbi:MoxR family ATPase [Heyndrickxia oleronia]|uniref:AAA family ATPase n=1 Tax=Heyndrickxia oleronia TaxID=38875 RepID=A0A8E2LFS1_9BACI|nr:MoxR family ATPase [Heyndrickxia oleronia]NYV68449.1 MoxR family ATPase [Bacillus sp. Gen3]OJH19680.1 AAA family ATPase [Bacillus obstructivus]MCM3457183.1 MoxR family ATPase [Heyndrickxia oleronia]MEC1377285.1 MoxR family ATPase [Heyndrickxia oleronia]OOP68469.1 AAA family ATPase [Heyndrickxia oleronia]